MKPKIVIKKEVLCAVIANLVYVIAVFCSGASASNNPDPRPAGKSKLDVLFVVDNSGSMKKNDPEFITREVVTNFLNGLAGESRIGMVIFDQDARLVVPLTDRAASQASGLFVKGLDKVNYAGQFTNSPAGMERAIYELKVNGRNEAKKVIIFLTDGIVDTGDKRQDIEREKWLREDLARESKKAGIRIFGIAFTEKADVHLIQTLALETDGEYFRAYRAAEIPGIFTKIDEIINKPSVRTVPLTSPSTETPTPASPDITPIPPPAAEYRPASWKSYLSLLTVIVACVLLGIMILLKFFKRKTRMPLEPGADDRRRSRPFPPSQPMPEAKLIDVKEVSSKGSLPFVLNKDRISIGRDLGNDIVVAQETVSSFHATIEYGDGYFYLEDHRSTNGTFLNNKRIDQNKPVKLKSGDRVCFAAYEFKFLMVDHDPVGETVMLGSSSLPIRTDHILETQSTREEVNDSIIFKDCLGKHLDRIRALGSTYESFVNQYIHDDIIDILAGMAKEAMSLTQADLDEHGATLAKPPVLYQLCTLPVEIEHARTWFSQKHGGYVKFINNSFSSKHFTTPGCTVLCLITYGRTTDAWISITIVPAVDDPDPVEIMSVEFLSEEEKRTLSLDFGELGRII
jgi:pSer/pThr/pTyr-binding forkhead associated (FHA) protein/Mg-chelatase subunit ChlD